MCIGKHFSKKLQLFNIFLYSLEEKAFILFYLVCITLHFHLKIFSVGTRPIVHKRNA